MQLSAIIEALLFASQAPLTADELARLVRARVAEAEDCRAREIEEGKAPQPLPDWLTQLAATSPADTSQALLTLNHSYEHSHRAFTLSERPKGWTILTRSEFGEFVRQLFPDRKPERFSGPAMETLAIIAYRQPITKAAIEAVRGVACDGMLQKLLDRDLIRIGGRAELPGRPLLYETTELFFDHFGIRSIDDLPNSSELRKVKLPEPPPTHPVADPEQQLALGAIASPAPAPAPAPAASPAPPASPPAPTP
jgi:segregation and condensation protein B